ncbi:hypothetical protein [Winogradskyella tangerina]|uniref:hypothetical protein n=1 Tax=Winogradskyella tangerina TaxID=2023240 RepID=UPI000DBE0DDA|nr:hypothetical protein [Winogradskyella tangerina]
MKINRRNIILGILLIILLWAISGILIYLNFDNESRGTLGDMFGAINALFSGLALFGIIISILIQQKELNYQRQELEETRLEFKTNRITTILFKQLDYLNKVIDELTYNPTNKTETNTAVNVSIEKFVSNLDKLKENDNLNRIKELVDLNRKTIIKSVERINIVLELIENVLKTNNLESNDIAQMKKLFIGNINPFIFPLLSHYLENLNPIPEVVDEITKIEKDLIAYELNEIMKIMDFAKDK